MSPPIRDGSGSSIGSIRLGDGSEISEVRTGAGDVLFSAIPDSVVDDFEDQDLSEYSGDTSNYAIVSSPVHDGNHALEATDANGFSSQIITSQSGLDNYVQKGDRFRVWMRPPDNFGGSIRVLFGVQDASNSFEIGLLTGQSIVLNKRSGGSTTTLDSDTSFSPTGDTWFQARGEWADSDSISVEIYDDSETLQGSVSATDSDYANETGIGYHIRGKAGQTGNVDTYVTD